ncbi:helix-turn-helix transcriptional regulator [Sinorhizobium meliloti]|uniref:helix-turn-helix transcriptional regulator n=1 Tax=Rhizobium meliloti TaxID=382 RepID=UPI0001E4A626|nr:AlpA family transcriptional regulator [Sinorhizobium meliloti]AEG53102.1 phage transcriptional regulator, AlpA [Sinorhizobium meliloti AK83]MDE4591184.1 AlpA family transcriptional regulator [Sinorhizobium meliloti]SEI55252.1 transcriptional regulator, AlpA family [Sinorhizobium meliloti]
MFTQAAPADTTRFLRIGDILDRVPVSRPTIYRLMKKNEFPKCVTIGSSSLWIESEVDAWMQEKIASR